MDELTQDVGLELHTESIIHRAEQLARLESDKIVDKVSRCMQLSNAHFSAPAPTRSDREKCARAKNTIRSYLYVLYGMLNLL